MTFYGSCLLRSQGERSMMAQAVYSPCDGKFQKAPTTGCPRSDVRDQRGKQLVERLGLFQRGHVTGVRDNVQPGSGD